MLKEPEKAGPQGVLKDVWPKGYHPATGEPFVRCEHFKQETEVDERTYGPPAAPSRQVYEYNDDIDDYVYVREMTDAEYAKAQEEREEALKRWHESGGIIRIQGPTTTTAKFLTESGDWAEGILVGDNEWRWAAYSPPGVACRCHGCGLVVDAVGGGKPEGWGEMKMADQDGNHETDTVLVENDMRCFLRAQALLCKEVHSASKGKATGFNISFMPSVSVEFLKIEFKVGGGA